ncbi:MAG: bis(5'-nucleosyl)-tetraphosphatase (symmetrical) YqeK [Anaerolineales bacterium]
MMMEDYLEQFTRTGQLETDMSSFLTSCGYPKTAEHCAAVAAEAKNLAVRFQSNPHQAEQAGYLHDISAVIPVNQRLELAHSYNIEVLEEEKQFPMILHQKLSVVIAREIFQVTDSQVLSAIGCHTTLKTGASRLDKIVFLADKIAWDQDGTPAYLPEMRAALDQSLDSAVLVYLDFLWHQRSQLRVIHPWLVEARQELLQSA